MNFEELQKLAQENGHELARIHDFLYGYYFMLTPIVALKKQDELNKKYTSPATEEGVWLIAYYNGPKFDYYDYSKKFKTLGEVADFLEEGIYEEIDLSEFN